MCHMQSECDKVHYLCGSVPKPIGTPGCFKKKDASPQNCEADVTLNNLLCTEIMAVMEDICKTADDTLWIGPCETVFDRLWSVVEKNEGRKRLENKFPESA